MKLLIIGSQGNIGRRLMAAFPGSIGIDRLPGADIVADLATIDYAKPEIAAALSAADGVIHVATSANAHGPDDVHYQAVIDTARLLDACQRHKVPRLVLPSSDWAEPKPGWLEGVNTYGHSKRVFETMAAMYAHSTGLRCVALRIGWVPRSPQELVGAEKWLIANHWDDARLMAEFTAALGSEHDPEKL
jgi:nucleoside-diphosphate-sugar epimerase